MYLLSLISSITPEHVRVQILHIAYPPLLLLPNAGHAVAPVHQYHCIICTFIRQAEVLIQMLQIGRCSTERLLHLFVPCQSPVSTSAVIIPIIDALIEHQLHARRTVAALPAERVQQAVKAAGASVLAAVVALSLSAPAEATVTYGRKAESAAREVWLVALLRSNRPVFPLSLDFAYANFVLVASLMAGCVDHCMAVQCRRIQSRGLLSLLRSISNCWGGAELYLGTLVLSVLSDPIVHLQQRTSHWTNGSGGCVPPRPGYPLTAWLAGILRGRVEPPGRSV